MDRSRIDSGAAVRSMRGGASLCGHEQTPEVGRDVSSDPERLGDSLLHFRDSPLAASISRSAARRRSSAHDVRMPDEARIGAIG